MGVSDVFAKLASRWDGMAFLQWLHGDELIQVINEHLCLLECLHFTVRSQLEVLGLFLCPSLLSKNHICSSCALMHLNRLRILALRVSLSGGCRLTFASMGVQDVASFDFLSCKCISPNPMLLCGRILLGAKSLHVIFPRISARKDYAHETHTFG